MASPPGERIRRGRSDRQRNVIDFALRISGAVSPYFSSPGPRFRGRYIPLTVRPRPAAQAASWGQDGPRRASPVGVDPPVSLVEHAVKDVRVPALGCPQPPAGPPDATEVG